ncbi:MAG TPA: energy transducer TonB [Chthoniobacterales bacterium]|nr:energy transducer TonB [Chthoniobacterales bacterium]
MKPVLYRPGSKAPLAAAFSLAAAIHVSALAVAVSREPAIINPYEPNTIIEAFDPPEPQNPEPEPPPIIETPIPQVEQPNEFHEVAEPSPRPLPKARPIRPPGLTPAKQNAAAGNGKVFAINAPRPAYPYQARRHHITGSGVALLEVNPESGSVLAARIVQSTGSNMLDNSALSAFKRWRFRNGSPSQIRIPFTFTMYGVQF